MFAGNRVVTILMSALKLIFHFEIVEGVSVKCCNCVETDNGIARSLCTSLKVSWEKGKLMTSRDTQITFTFQSFHTTLECLSQSNDYSH